MRASIVPERMTTPALWHLLESELVVASVHPTNRPAHLRHYGAITAARQIVRELRMRGEQLRFME